jgi:hypothetical protein
LDEALEVFNIGLIIREYKGYKEKLTGTLKHSTRMETG